MRQYFIGIIGHSGSGKTTILEKLIEIFNRRDYVVGAIKHDAHSFEIDYPGKDSYRLKHAGAKRIVLSSMHKLALIEDRENEKPLSDIKTMFDDCDIVFIEGYKLEDLPKIEVHRKETSNDYLIDNGIKNIILVATNEMDIRFDVPSVHIDDVSSIADFIERKIDKYR